MALKELLLYPKTGAGNYILSLFGYIFLALVSKQTNKHIASLTDFWFIKGAKFETLQLV